ncbi:MAG: M42 family metallopeptidase [Clostridia bacterium]|nr:M42 family metallopeptidase [Clostridia bacterium]
MLNEIKTLCTLNGTSGREANIRDYIIKEIADYADYTVDALGNIIAFKKGSQPRNKKLMVCAHMDEVALIITYINSNGFLKFTCVGGIDPQVLAGKTVSVNGNVGVIGVKPTHLLSSKEKESFPSVSDLYIDIGATSDEDARKYVAEGDIAYFVSDCIELGTDMLKAKAIDDRFGCAVLLKLIRQEIRYDTYFVFTVQEEVGTRGAMTSAFSVAPDYAIVIEATTAADLLGVEGENKVCELGKGAVVSFMDRGTVYDNNLYKFSFSLAKKRNIDIQTKTKVAGGNDASAIHKSRCGVKTVAVSVPCRYIHSPSCVVNKKDIDSVYSLVNALIEELPND